MQTVTITKTNKRNIVLKDMNENLYAYIDEQVTNITTALMAIRDVATYTEIPINVQFDSHVITVIVNFGKWNVKMEHFYLQDMYRYHQSSDMIYKWIKEAVEEIVKRRER